MVFFIAYPQVRPRRKMLSAQPYTRPRNDRSVFSSTYQLLFPQPLSFENHTNAPEVCGVRSEYQAKIKHLSPLESALTKNGGGRKLIG